jgi:hypothetical protein
MLFLANPIYSMTIQHCFFPNISLLQQHRPCAWIILVRHMSVEGQCRVFEHLRAGF